MAETSLYLLVHRDNAKFKIGVSTNLLNRMTSLGGIQLFNLSRCVEIVLPSSRDAFRFEKSLHFLYEAHKTEAPLETRDGLSEWFDYASFPDVFKAVIAMMKTKRISESHLHIGIILPDVSLYVSHNKRRLTNEEKELEGLKYLNEIFRPGFDGRINRIIEWLKEIEPYLIKSELSEKLWRLHYKNAPVTYPICKKLMEGRNWLHTIEPDKRRKSVLSWDPIAWMEYPSVEFEKEMREADTCILGFSPFYVFYDLKKSGYDSYIKLIRFLQKYDSFFLGFC